MVIGISRGRVIAYPERHLSRSLGFLKILICLLLPLSYLRGATLDFVDTPLADVVRAMSRAYDTPMLVDDSLNIRVTFHLDGVGVMEGLTALCSAHGLEVVQEGSVFHVRRARARGESEFRMQDSLVTLSVKGQEVNEFVREFSLNSGLNILASPGLEGRITGTLRGMPAEGAFRALMGAHGFRVWREGECLRVGERLRQSAKAGANDRGGNSSGNIRLERDGDLYSAEIAEGELLQVLVNGAVLQQRAFGFHASLHLFLIVLVVPAEHLHQRVVAVFQSEKGVLHLLRRDEVVTLHDFLIVLVDAHPHLVKHTIRFKCRRASARDTSPFGVPQLRVDSQFAAELRLAAVHRDASHDGNCPVLFHYLTLEVVDD